ncbi:MAG: ester cyclase [Cyclobacteriaceae bacterium]
MKTVRSNLVSMTILVIVIALQSCDQTLQKETKNKASLINANHELLNNGNLDFADEAFTADYSGRGPALIKEFVSDIRTAFPDLNVKVDPIIAEGDMVAWLRTSTGTQTGDYMGYKPTAKKITWKEMVFTRYTSDGKVAEEWSVSDMHERLQAATGVEGVFEYLPPLKGQSVIRNGHFVYLFGPADGKGPMISQAGTHTISGDTIKNTITYCTDPRQIGTVYWWRAKSWSGDTLTYETMNEKGQITGGGSGIKITS